jgi:hypothetical protein
MSGAHGVRITVAADQEGDRIVASTLGNNVWRQFRGMAVIAHAINGTATEVHAAVNVIRPPLTKETGQRIASWTVPGEALENPGGLRFEHRFLLNPSQRAALRDQSPATQ